MGDHHRSTHHHSGNDVWIFFQESYANLDVVKDGLFRMVENEGCQCLRSLRDDLAGRVSVFLNLTDSNQNN